MEALWIVVILVSLLSLLASILLSRWVKQQDAGTERMSEIADFIREGAFAFLFRQYRTIAIFTVSMFFFLTLAIGLWTSIPFFIGAFLSAFAGFWGMETATRANCRTAAAARVEGMKAALKIAFRGGGVMGLCVSGLGVLGITALCWIATQEPIEALTGFTLGVSTIALFARVGGGIYTKAADMGADLVGKIEAGIPEDDPRNPAVIADNVGDNVGDVAGMGSDLFESYVGAIVSCLILAITMPDIPVREGIMLPLLLAAAGIIASIVAIVVAGKVHGKSPAFALNFAVYLAAGLVLLAALVLSFWLFGNFNAFASVALGILTGSAIGFFTERYTSDSYRSVREIAMQSKFGPAVTIVNGFAIGMYSTLWPIIIVAAAIFFSYFFFGVYGIALSAVGMLSTVAIVVSVDTYGPISDNAGGIAQMAQLDPEVRAITDKLDSVGNTTAAIGKGFAIGSAALTALALYVSYAQIADIRNIDLLTTPVVIGMFIGSMLPFLFSSLTIKSVGRAAFKMIEEVRNQIKLKPGIMDGSEIPDYAKCVDISTSAALQEMVIPSLLAVFAPLAVGVILGTEALGGLLGGAMVTGVVLAITMNNAGGAWDNAKKYIEAGNHGGKGSAAHQAAVIGDTIGDPMKDTAGPSINTLIKLMTVVSLVFLPLLVR